MRIAVQHDDSIGMCAASRDDRREHAECKERTDKIFIQADPVSRGASAACAAPASGFCPSSAHHIALQVGYLKVFVVHDSERRSGDACEACARAPQSVSDHGRAHQIHASLSRTWGAVRSTRSASPWRPRDALPRSALQPARRVQECVRQCTCLLSAARTVAGPLEGIEAVWVRRIGSSRQALRCQSRAPRL